MMDRWAQKIKQLNLWMSQIIDIVDRYGYLIIDVDLPASMHFDSLSGKAEI